DRVVRAGFIGRPGVVASDVGQRQDRDREQQREMLRHDLASWPWWVEPTRGAGSGPVESARRRSRRYLDRYDLETWPDDLAVRIYVVVQLSPLRYRRGLSADESDAKEKRSPSSTGRRQEGAPQERGHRRHDVARAARERRT